MSVTAPSASGRRVSPPDIKSGGARDLALVVNDGPSRAAAGVFTANRVKAAPVLWSQQVLRGGRVARGRAQLRRRQRLHRPARASRTPTPPRRRSPRRSATPRGEIAVCSTGLIGERLPMDALLAGVEPAAAQLARDGGLAAADAIRTTDTVSKISFRRGEGGYMVGGMAKGAGMLAPGLATMLVRDHHRRRPARRRSSTRRCARPPRVTFDRLDTDGCMSTNDTVLLLASGASGVTPDLDEFEQMVTRRLRRPGRQLLVDAEGATKAIAIEVVGAASEDDAVDGRPRRLPQQPAQVRHPRRGPQLGPGAVGGRHHRRGLRARPAQRGHQRHLDLPGRRGRRRPRPRSTCAPAT